MGTLLSLYIIFVRSKLTGTQKNGHFLLSPPPTFLLEDYFLVHSDGNVPWKETLPFSWGSFHCAMCRRSCWSTRCRCWKETAHCCWSDCGDRGDQGGQPPHQGLSKQGLLTWYSAGIPEKGGKLWAGAWLRGQEIPLNLLVRQKWIDQINLSELVFFLKSE